MASVFKVDLQKCNIPSTNKNDGNRDNNNNNNNKGEIMEKHTQPPTHKIDKEIN